MSHCTIKLVKKLVIWQYCAKRVLVFHTPTKEDGIKHGSRIRLITVASSRCDQILKWRRWQSWFETDKRVVKPNFHEDCASQKTQQIHNAERDRLWKCFSLFYKLTEGPSRTPYVNKTSPTTTSNGMCLDTIFSPANCVLHSNRTPGPQYNLVNLNYFRASGRMTKTSWSLLYPQSQISRTSPIPSSVVDVPHAFATSKSECIWSAVWLLWLILGRHQLLD